MFDDGPELWIGPECTVNRVHDHFHDQFDRSGHTDRIADLDLFAQLGAKAVRYPVLWENIAPDRPDRCDWTWIDPRLTRLRDLGLDVIAGLVHHGSGPAYTDLLDDEGFATGLAKHAGNVAERFPWIESWTPVNEPLTTARFSTIYGYWHPHATDERSFWRALLNQIDGVRLSMAAVRVVNPAAKLIQTDDLGRTYATAEMSSQAAFDNTRRWAGWDLLCGRVVPGHALWERLAGLGLQQRLERIAADPCPPDVIGLNHYLTSDRFLDHRVHRYPPSVHGGNGRQRYADVEASRVLDPAPAGVEGALREAWERYHIPLALTEVHNGCTREEQLRWVAQAWDTATRLAKEGVAVRAVTIWSLLGSADWNRLLTGPGVYEPGVYDVRSGSPRPTQIATLVSGLPKGAARHPAAQGAGWWERPMRLTHSSVRRAAPLAAHREHRDASLASPPLLILGATGTLGQAFARACVHRDLAHVLTARGEVELSDGDSIARALARHRPWAVINAAGWVRVDDAEDEPEACLAANADAAIELARRAADIGIPTLSFSSDLVFDGRLGRAYTEDDPVSPLGVYGKSKAQMEDGLASLAGSHLIVRTAAFFSHDDVHNFAVAAAAAARRRQAFHAASDLHVSPTYVPHLVAACLDLLIDGEHGLWHLTNGTAVSWAEFAQRVCKSLGLPQGYIVPTCASELGFKAERPRNAALESRKGANMPELDEALAQFAGGYSHVACRARASG